MLAVAFQSSLYDTGRMYTHHAVPALWARLASMFCVALLCGILPATAQPPEGGVIMFGGPGGPPGGPEGGRGGGFRRFDPTDFIRRLDTNGNGALDPEEQQGPAQFMLRRIAERNPEIDLSKPIPISQLGEMMSRGRGGFGGGEGGDFGGEQDDPSMVVPESLVPGFGIKEPPVPPSGFGAKGGLFAVRVSPEDTKEAQERIRQFDRNRNGLLDSDELAGRWSGNPLDFDRNGDGKLSENELAVRAARRRIARVDAEKKKADAERRNQSIASTGDQQEAEDRMQGRRSYRHAERAVHEGLPDWFKSSDSNDDGQVEMSEYTPDWTDEKLAEFVAFDANADGLITEREAAGLDRSRESSLGSGSESSKPKREVKRSGTLKPAYRKWAERTIKRNDKDNDGVLSRDEASRLDVDPTPADTNEDGKISVEEYAWWSQSNAEGNR